MKLGEVVRLFEQFGFHEAHVRDALAAGDSVFNAFEGLKTTLMLHWDEMNQTEPIDKLKELKPVYDRIMGLSLKSATKQSDVAKERARAAVDAADDAMRKTDFHTRKNMAMFMDTLRTRLEEARKEDPDNPRVKAALERLERGEAPF
jgi:hypothetical protein